MKKFLRWAVEFKTHACLTFTAAVCILMTVCWIWGWEESVNITMLFQLLVASVCMTFLQWVCFSAPILGKTRYTVRLLLFTVTTFPVLAVLAWLGDWFPRDQLGAWVLFAMIFLAMLGVFTVSYEIYYRITGRRFDQRLEEYREEHKE